MGFFDDLAGKLKQGLETVQKKGGEAATVAKLRYELFNLNRDLEGQFNKLGKAVFEGHDFVANEAIKLEITRIKAEVLKLETAIRETGEDPHAPPEGTDHPAAEHPTAPSGAPHPASGEHTTSGGSVIDMEKKV